MMIRRRRRRMMMGAGVSLPADTLAAGGITTLAWFSPFKARKAYSGPAMRVRRSSDNAEQDIGFNRSGLDTAALMAFVGSGSGFVTTMYEQMGSGLHAVQDTASLQPNIVTSGVLEVLNGSPAPRNSGGTNTHLLAPITVPVGAFTFGATFALNGVTTGARGVAGNEPGTNSNANIRGNGQVLVGSASISVAAPTPNVPTCVFGQVDGGPGTGIAARTRRDGVLYGPASASRGAPVLGIYYGAAAGPLSNNSWVGEYILVDGAPDLSIVAPVVARVRGLAG